ncbi:MAG: DUF3119 family protein [Cyanobacteriota bacterium]|nr:DUF3119 family protein [Cyanobacteriota bacterium]
MTSAPPATSTTVDPDFRLAMAIIGLGLPWLWISGYLGAGIMAFGLFLTIQTASLRLVFAPTTLEVYRGSTQIRSFPYSDWLHWQLYTPALPILFYFREVKSIHFLPVIFNPAQLQACLAEYVGSLAQPATSPSDSLIDDSVEG